MNIIHVNRSVRLSYPEWVEKIMHPELKNTGFAEYDISAVEQWLHDGQKDGNIIEGGKIYSHLKDTDKLKTCLGLRDLEEIQKKDLVFFRKHFQGRAVFGWKSIVLHYYGYIVVPCLYEGNFGVVLSWEQLGHYWDDSKPALRFASSSQR